MRTGVGHWAGSWGTGMTGMIFRCDAVWGRTVPWQRGEEIDSWINQGKWDQFLLLSIIISSAPVLSAYGSCNMICSLASPHVAGNRGPTRACAGPPAENRQNWGWSFSHLSEVGCQVRADANPSPTSSSPEVWQDSPGESLHSCTLLL